MNLKQITELAAQDMAEVNIALYKQLESEVSLINRLSHYIISSGGKRVRPMITVLTARALQYQGKKHIAIATLIEFIHTATLLHDDVVDKSDKRRGKATANATFGNAASVLVGDFIYTRAFQMMTTLESIKLLKLMSEAVNVIAEGEILQLMNCHDPNVSIDRYMSIIYRKTARLFEAASQSSAILVGAGVQHETALRDYGRYLGTAFQLMDDLLDYGSNEKILGKHAGNDLNEGKPTLPLLHAMHNGTPEQTAIIRRAIQKGNGRHLLNIVLETMHQCDSLEYTRRRAEKEVEKAVACLACLTPSPYLEALKGLAYSTIERDD